MGFVIAPQQISPRIDKNSSVLNAFMGLAQEREQEEDSQLRRQPFQSCNGLAVHRNGQFPHLTDPIRGIPSKKSLWETY